MPITATINVTNSAGISQSVVDQVTAAINVALQQWSTYISASTNLTIQLELLTTTSSNRAQGGAAAVFSVGAPQSGGVNYEGAPGWQLRHESNPNGSSSDVLIQIAQDYLLNELWFDSTPGTSSDIPSNRTDAISVLVHELGHALGFIGYYDEASNTFPGGNHSPYDWRLVQIGGQTYFDGPNVRAVYGNAVPLTDNNFAHYGNISQPPGANLLAGLMNGVAYYRGVRYTISDLDLAFLADMGIGTTRNDIFDQTWLDVIRAGPGDDVFRGNYSTSASAVTISGAAAIRTAPGLQLYDLERFDVTLSANGDSFTGTENNDIVRGNAGADTLVGGQGFDIAVYNGASTGATWTHNAVTGGWTVVSGADGTDTVSGIELLDFTDRDVHLDATERTFSGDGTSDVLFRRSDGIMASWNVNGVTISNAYFLPTAGAEWTPMGTGDFNGDGKADVLWQRNDGLVYTWQMNGGAVAQANALTGIGSEWHFLHTGDFNGDARDDMAWQRTDGLVYLWLMNGAVISTAAPVVGLGAEWTLQGVGDFNSDGKDDFLWRNSSGQLVIWHMNGATIASSGFTSQAAGLEWSVVGIGDTNMDARDDIILQRASDGMIAVWAMDGTTVSSATNVAAANPAQWEVQGVGDYNGDGRDDILWQQNDGLVYVWLLNGASIIGSGGLSGVDSDWSIIGGG